MDDQSEGEIQWARRRNTKPNKRNKRLSTSTIERDNGLAIQQKLTNIKQVILWSEDLQNVTIKILKHLPQDNLGCTTIHESKQDYNGPKPHHWFREDEEKARRRFQLLAFSLEYQVRNISIKENFIFYFQENHYKHYSNTLHKEEHKHTSTIWSAETSSLHLY